jgi:hypothetical protein
LGKVTRVCFPKLTQAIWPDFGEQVALSVFGRFFHVIDDQELAGTLGPFESQPFSEHGIDSMMRKFIRELGSIGRVLRPRGWANCAMVPPGRSVLMRREVLLSLGWPHQGFSPGGNEGCDRSLEVQLPTLDGWSLRHSWRQSASISGLLQFRDGTSAETALQGASQDGPIHHLLADDISRLRADLVTVGIDPGRAPFEHRSRADGVAISLLTN